LRCFCNLYQESFFNTQNLLHPGFGIFWKISGISLYFKDKNLGSINMTVKLGGQNYSCGKEPALSAIWLERVGEGATD
jgi:hypothetical protein